MTDSAEIVREFGQHAALYQSLVNAVASLVQQALAAENIQVHSVTCRVKRQESLQRKLLRPGKTYQSLSDITDLAGVRIIAHFADDVDKIAIAVQGLFEIESSQSVDKRQLLDPDRFGYLSLHYIAKLTTQRATLIEYNRFSHLKFEIQVRSVLQHAWAEIEHDLGYKSAIEVPKNIRRRFARVASLLELADDEFIAIRKELAEYSVAAGSEIQRAAENVELDRVTLEALMSSNSALRQLDDVVARVARTTISHDIDEAYQWSLPGLAIFGVKSINALEDASRSRKELVSQFAEYWLKGVSQESLGVGIGLFYLLYVLAWQTQSASKVSAYLGEANIGADDDEETQSEIVARILSFQPKSLASQA